MPFFARTFAFDPDDARVHETRPDHRAYVAELFGRGEIRMSGPWTTMDGALIIYVADDEQAARALIAADPYRTRDVVTELDLREWHVTTE